MAFEDVDILVRLGSGENETRWRQDADVGSLVTFALSDTRDVRTWEWLLIGRPEGSGAGGGGPEPIPLSTSQACSITLDIPGAYIVACTINGGSPNQTFKTAGVSILCVTTDPVGRPLRYLGGHETDEDLADPLVAQGWIKMLNRWLHALEAFIQGGGVDTFKVKIDAADTVPDYLEDKLEGDGTTTSFEVVTAPDGKKKMVAHAQADDHEVKADATDTGHGPLKDKLKNTASLVWSVDTTGGVHTVKGDVQGIPAADDHLIKARNADATTVGGLMEKTVDSPTIKRTLTVNGDGVEVVAFNTLAQADPITFASTLYAARLNDAALHAQVDTCYYQGGFAAATYIFPRGWWTQIRPGVWQANITGRSLLDGNIGGATLRKGLRMYAGGLNPLWPVIEQDRPHTGVYVVTCPGFRLDEYGNEIAEYLVVERADDANAAAEFEDGLVVYVQGGEYAGKYIRLTTTAPVTLGTTPLAWELLDSYTETASDNLLTAAQLARASETPMTAGLMASIGVPSAWLEFPTLAGTPNLDTYKAGRTEAWALARLFSACSEGKTIWLEIQVVRDPGGDNAVLETISTSPVTNLTDEIINAHIDDDEDQDLAGDTIGLRIRARSDSTTPAAIAVTWSDPAHSTRLLTPMTLAVGGTDDHQALTPASRGFVAGEEAAARARCHPMASIEPGLITWVPGADVATVDGLLTLPPKTNAVRISGTEPLLGVSDTFLAAGSSAVLYVEFASARQVVVSANAPTGFRGFGFYGPLGFSATPYAFLAPANSAMVLYASGGVWNVLSAPWVEPQRALWPTFASLTINTTTAPGLLELPIGCPGVIYVTGTELRAITVLDVDGKGIAGPLAGIQLHFLNACRLYHLDALTGWDAGLAAGAGKLDLLPPTDATGDDCDMIIPARRTLRMLRDSTGEDMLWIPEVAQ